MKFTVDHLYKLLSILVIPLVIWGAKLEVNNAVQTQSIERLESDVQKLEAIEETVRANSIALAQLKERIDAANNTLGDIKALLRNRDSP